MKKIYFIAIAALCGLSVRAQTNLIAPTNSAPRVTHIDSDSADFDMNARTAIYRGNVRVSDPDMKLTCVRLVADLPQSGRMNHIVAETNVVIDYTDAKGQTTHATGDKAVYNYAVENGATNETVTLTGNAKVENAQGCLTGEPITWNRAADHLTATNPKMIYRQNLNSTPAETNLPTANTNQMSEPK
ncbi:MAG TPA: LptA/OstA family protein [Methylomirabilota bacterium]|nr:LptA/OstA family protein [Methylomirabilota bacterium]